MNEKLLISRFGPKWGVMPQATKRTEKLSMVASVVSPSTNFSNYSSNNCGKSFKTLNNKAF